MNHYTYQEIDVGFTQAFTAQITNDKMQSFYQITGDCNPLHMDDAFARGQEGNRYTARVVYGMLTASYLSTMAGVYLPGEHSLIHRVETEFPHPVYVGDTLTFVGKVVRKDDNFKTIEVKVSATNQHGKKVLRGKMRIEVLQ